MKSKVKVLHFSTHYENCGIGKYQEMFLDAMEGSDKVENIFFELSPNQIKMMESLDYDNAFKLLEENLKGFDVLHIQHEFSFYWNDEMERAVKIAKNLEKKIIVTIHTSPSVVHKKARITGLGPRSVLHYLRLLKAEKRFIRRFVSPIKSADIILVHNETTKRALEERGVPGGRIKKILIPVPEVEFTRKSDEISKALNVKSEDVVYCTVGFLHKFKGVKEAIKALCYLPDNYKLAIVGGMHEDHSAKFYDEITDLVLDLDLTDRVYITGYVAEDDRMNALLRECSVAVYPYDKEYYANVSSAALNNAFANHLPILAYPAESFKEINKAYGPALKLTSTFSYYELARELQKVNLEELAKDSKEFADKASYSQIAPSLVEHYINLVGRS